MARRFRGFEFGANCRIFIRPKLFNEKSSNLLAPANDPVFRRRNDRGFRLGCGGTSTPKSELGSQTAKNGFRNEDEIAAKLNNWRADEDARTWLAAMNYKSAEIVGVAATKPHGEKSDVQLAIKTKKGEFSEGISIKLVSSENGFNQIDKRWLSHYAKMWQLPQDVIDTLKLFVGEVKPSGPSRSSERMFLDELDKQKQKAVVDFFTAKKARSSPTCSKAMECYSADWIMAAFKAGAKPRWVLRRIDYAVDYFSRGAVQITSGGNLRIGRITMQRKGGDAGRGTARMLQFKINPALLFD